MNFNFKILKNFLLKDKSIEFDLDNNELLNFKKKNNKKLIIGTACGRSGLRWISEIHSSHKNFEVQNNFWLSKVHGHRQGLL